ncbi:aldo/keto reductase [Streptomyces syringium]|uniref:aldo/keto reductase n=1 Tax=Streptomyces syringium TaxID=76729 RepID=UPI003AAD97DB
MTAALTLGTYRCRDVAEAAAIAAASGARWIDTAPNYTKGQAQRQLAAVLAAHPEIHISTKAGFLTTDAAEAAVRDGILGDTTAGAAGGHCLEATFVRWQVSRNRAELGRSRLDTLLLHNPERTHHRDRAGLHSTLRKAFAALEEEAAAGHVAGYGIATWTCFNDGAFTVEELLTLARQAAGGDHRFTTIQLPISLIEITPLADALTGRGPIPPATGAGLHVMASAPLGGGQLPPLVDRELADFIRPGLGPAEACLLTVASCPGVTHVLLSASTAPHWQQAADTLARPLLAPDHLREITGVLAPTRPSHRTAHAHPA